MGTPVIGVNLLQSVTISQGNICKILGFFRFKRHYDDEAPAKKRTRRAVFLPGSEMGGERDRIRTCDPVIKSHLLYQLSYAPTFVVRRGQVTLGYTQPLDLFLPKA